MEFHQTLQTNFKTNTNNKNLRARGQYYWELFPFVILSGFCIDSFLNILKSHCWNFIKPCKVCKHISIFKTNTDNQTYELGANTIGVISL